MSDIKDFIVEKKILKKYIGKEKIVEIPSGITTIGFNAFVNCEEIEEVILNNEITKIDNFAFCKCTNLVSIIIPDSVTTIGYHAFKNCVSLSNIILSKNISEIGAYTFYNCSSLPSIIIPDNVIKIGDSAFENCKNLKEVQKPAGIKVGNNAFLGSGMKKKKALNDKYKMRISYDGGKETLVRSGFDSVEDCYNYAEEKGENKGCSVVVYTVIDSDGNEENYSICF